VSGNCLCVTPSTTTDRLFGPSIADAKQINPGEGYWMRVHQGVLVAG
jgi:hypothetical protein